MQLHPLNFIKRDGVWYSRIQHQTAIFKEKRARARPVFKLAPFIDKEIEYNARKRLKNGKTPSWGIFFRQDCVDWT